MIFITALDSSGAVTLHRESIPAALKRPLIDISRLERAGRHAGRCRLHSQGVRTVRGAGNANQMDFHNRDYLIPREP